MVLPTMTGQRLAVQNSSVRSAHCPPLALVATDSAAAPGTSNAYRDAEHAVASSRCPDRQVGTDMVGSGVGPSTSTFEPMPRSSCTRRLRPSIHAGSYNVEPGSELSVPYDRAETTTTSWGCSARNRAMIPERQCAQC